MGAPEKIYIVEDRQKHEPMEYWYNSTTDDSKIEYTRTDTFIEKVEDYLNSQLYGWVSVTNPDQKSYPYIIPKEDFINVFKNYMKGE